METSNYLSRRTRFWIFPVIAGLIYIGFGIWCLCNPSSSLPILAYICAGCIGAVGIFNFIYGLCNFGRMSGAGWAAAAGVVEILVSIFLFFLPTEVLTFAFVYGIGLYIIFMAVFSFFDNLSLSRYSGFWLWWMILLILGAIVFACIFILAPIGAGVIGWLSIGISFICYGLYRVILGAKIRRLNKDFAE